MRRRQSGTTTVEFAIVGALFFVLLFGVIEFGRLLYVWNALDATTRRAARLAAVCPIDNAGIARVAIFNAPTDDGPSDVIGGLSPANVQLEYLDANGAPLADPTASYTSIRYVEASVTGYRIHLYIPFFSPTFTAPAFRTVLPRESLGVNPDDATATCFGMAG